MAKKIKLVFSILILIFLVSLTGCGEKHVHEYGDWTLTVNPTETETGEAKKECSCGDVVTITVPTLSDESVWKVEIKDSTCTVKGSKTYTSIYGKVEISLPLKNHEYGDWTLIVKPTLETTGKASRTCKYGETETIEVPNLTDTNVWTLTEVKPTCKLEGKKTYTSIYGKVEEIVSKLEHTFLDYTMTIIPTETEVGKANRKCSVCGEVEEVEVPVLTDKTVWEVVEIKPTCLKEGKKTYTSIYGKVEIVLEKLEHEYGDWTLTKAPTLTNDGEAVRTCSKCGKTETQTVSKLNDTTVWKKEVKVESNYNTTGLVNYVSIYGTIEEVLPKLTAPYDNKTYYAFAFDSEDESTGGYKNSELSVETAWNKVQLKLDSNGKGRGTAHPFKGNYELYLVDNKTGELEIRIYENRNSKDYIKVKGYVDFESGIIVAPNTNNFKFIQVWTPFESGVDNTKAFAASWDNSIAIEYTYNSKTYTIYVNDDRVYFDVTFTDLFNNPISSKDCYQSDFVYIKQNNEVIKAYSMNPITKRLVLSDGLEGKYSGKNGDLLLNGSGKALLNGKEGTYKVAKENSVYSVDLFINNEYFEVTLVNKTYTLNKVMVEVTLNGLGYGEIQKLSVNKNIVLDLPILTHPNQVFKGWFYDEFGFEPVEKEFIPTSNITLFASWSPKVIINLIGTINGDNNKLYLGEGDIIGDYLPKYDVDTINRKQFVGWYLDTDFTISLPEEAEVTVDDTNIKIYAKWVDLKSYYGSYKGTEYYGLKNTGSSIKDIFIDELDNITGFINGKIISYDINSHIITYKSTELDSEIKKMYFDETSKVIICLENGKEINGSNYYLFIQDSKKGAVNSFITINIKDKTGLSNGYFARLFNIDTVNGNKDILVLYNEIYADVSFSNVLGETLTPSEVNKSKTIIVKNNKDGQILLAYGTKGENFESDNSDLNQELDSYYGIYKNGNDTLVLDGIGGVSYNGKIGNYHQQVNNPKIFDVYLNNSTEYYELTLNNDTFNLNKVMVTINFVVGEGHNNINSVTVNKNVLYTLPVITEEGFVFNGWYIENTFTTLVTTIRPNSDTTIYAKFSKPAILTIHYNNNNNTPIETITYSVNDVVNIIRPTYKGYTFVGWYTTKEFTPGSEYVMGQRITQDTEIYAKWDMSPLYCNSFFALSIEGKNGSNKSHYYGQGAPSYNEYGDNVQGGWYPFNEGTKFINYNPTLGTLDFLRNGSTYPAFINEDGIIVVGQSTDRTINQVWLLGPKETANFEARVESSYWQDGYSRLIVYKDIFNKVQKIFVYNNKVYFNVSFSDLNGEEIVDVNMAYMSKTGVRVFTEDKKLIAEFGYNGEALVNLDGLQGTYTNNNEIVILDGASNITYNNRLGKYEILDKVNNIISAVVDNTYYELTLLNDTFSIVKPTVNITFDANGGKLAGNKTRTYNKNILTTLPIPEKQGFEFKGWLDNNMVVLNPYIPTKDLTLKASWAEAYYVTFMMNNGAPNEDMPIEKNTPVTLVPTFEGHLFMGWYYDDNCTKKYDNEKVTSDMTLYGKWMEMPTYFGNYVGTEFDDKSVFKGQKLTINEDFTFTFNRYNGTILPETYDEVNHSIKFKDQYTSNNVLYYNIFNDVEYIILNYLKSSYDVISDDFYVFTKCTNNTESHVYTWNNNNNRIGFITYEEGTKLMYVDVKKNDFIAEISIEDLNGKALTYDELLVSNSLVIKDYQGNVLTRFLKVENEFVELDGLQGTYTGPFGTITLNGIYEVVFGVDAGSQVGSYKIIDNKIIELKYPDNSLKIISLDKSKNTYKQELDSTVGVYTRFSDTFTSNGDGTCKLNEKIGTYTFDGIYITYTVDNKSDYIRFNDEGSFFTKEDVSPLGGFTFVGMTTSIDWNVGEIENQVEMSFYFEKAIKGEIVFTPLGVYDSPKHYTFEGTLEGDFLTLSITSNKDMYAVINATVENGKITITYEELSEYTMNHMAATSEGFILK